MTVRAAEQFADPEISASVLRRAYRRLAYLVPERVGAWIKADLEPMGVWTPVAIGAGAGIYFGLKTEPHAALAVGLLLGALGVAVFAHNRHGPSGKVLVGLVLMALGFTAADWRTSQVAAPVLDRELGIRWVTGELVSIEDRARMRRMVVALHDIDGVDDDDLPARARISWRGAEFNAAPGDIIRLRAGLGPPPPPAAPGTFNFSRRLYFQKIGALGFAVSPPQVIAKTEAGRGDALRTQIETIRANLLHRITEAAPGEGGAIVAAIVTGKRDAITPRSKAALRDAGLAHMLAISGMHMGIATGLIFFTVRFGLAAIEPLALHYPIKKWAASAALLSGFAYLILSGGGWSARRAFITAAIMFAAILVDRRALSLRNVAIAAAIILLTTPEALFHPGFQMSFAAVTALVAGYEWFSRRADRDRSFSAFARVKRYAIALGVTDTIAAVATAPFALYHFNRVALYSLPANVLAMPLMGFWVMPAAIMALLLTPFGLDAWAWRISAEGVEAMLAIATEVSSWRGAVSFTWQWPPGALLVMTFGGLWFCLARSPLRLAGVAAIPLTALIVLAAPPPQVFVAASGLNAGVILPDGNRMAVFSTRRDRFSALVWGEAAGFDGDGAKPLAMNEVGACDARGCVLTINTKVAVFISDRRALGEDCARADLVVAFFPVSSADWRRCDAVLIDRRSVWRRGAHAVWLKPDGAIKITTVAEQSGRRPWTGNQ
jgi:competence protein ComEC